MAVLIVEDGTIVAGANVYASFSDVDLYHEDRGNTIWINEIDDDAK